MSIQDYHRELIAKIANALEDLNDETVYVGGAVASSHMTNSVLPSK